jgi:8-oxo-dGTP pyrophosphatase MutT (NUDIX family)
MTDITIPINGIRLNIRTALIIETENGYIFEKDRLDKFYFILGGRIQINENSIEAVKREAYEELGIEINDIKIKAIVESFFEYDNEKFHEICFYYKGNIIQKINLPQNFYILSMEEMNNVIIKPNILYDIINSKNNDIMHIIINQ